jgi:hypothetical protein
MHTRASISLCLAVVCLAVASGGCRSRERQPEAVREPGSVGFELPGNASVARGALLTQPPGHEEAFVPFVAIGAPGWIDACRGEAGGTAPLFSFETDAQGALRKPATDSGATARDRCLAARAASGGLSGLPAGTRVTVQLELRTP